MPKPSLAITIRTFTINEPVRAWLDSYFSVDFINTTGKRLSEKELMSAVRNADAVIAGTEPFSRAVLEPAQKLRVISRVGVGTDSVDMVTAEKKGITIQITTRATVQPVAEHTIALIFSMAKRITEYNNSARRNDYSVRTASLIQGKTVGIIGLGRIGKRVGEMMSALGCRVIFFDPFILKNPEPAWIQSPSLDELLAHSDIITLHIPAQRDNQPLMNREVFSRCRKGVLLVNTARGSLVDEKALYDAISRGVVAGAGLDVTIKEPYSGPLLGLPQVVFTPHVASNTTESRMAMEREAIENLILSVRREPQ